MTLYETRQGPPRSGQIIATRDEVKGVDPYTEVARRFFNEFLELKLSLERDGTIPIREQVALREKQQKELDKWQKAMNELKRSAQDLVKENKELSAEVDRLTGELEQVRRELNESIMKNESMRHRHNLPKDEPGKYPLTEHMSERAYQMWLDIERTMKQPPAGTKGED